MLDTSAEWIVQRTGICERRIAAPKETTFTMALEASRQALTVANLSAAKVDLIICATLTPEHPFPSTASLLQHALGATRAAGFDLEAACAGFIYALSVARAYIISGMAENILVIGSETMSRVVDWEDRSTCILFGDGAGAAVVRAVRGPAEVGGAIESVVLANDGSKASALIIPGGGSHSPTTEETVRQRLHFIQMNGSEVFKAAVRGMSDACLLAAERADLKLSELDLMVAHQANARIIEAVQRRLGLPDYKVYQNLQRYGNTSAASVPIALYDAQQEGRLRSGMRVAIAGFGGGFSCGAAIIRWG